MIAISSIKKTAFGLVTLLLLLASSPVVSTPVASDTLRVFIRADDGSYSPSESMASVIKARSSDWSLEKRSTATVKACSDAGCSNCNTVFDGSLDKNTGCLQAINTACLIVSNLNDANIQFWNHNECNGRSTVWRGCGSNNAFVSAPGTNSLGVHTGC
ncbi:uncharacterized protein LY89DRAFT_677176 [Mollisia scopiformis]|uniref:Uncharacterized protein n=1 Tax=Mollisia scopiformis TaxID=149040 RepID=A0A132B7C1_MOLSC|nr:uncharacterized protein LY89DRAFT_677176 [Mollisia scopiformis]KUJ08306.1 hypothetical protein LY89DRAFT_677176 [Mollisia scopiformis]